MKYYVVCDCREDFKSYINIPNDIPYNDHPERKNVNELVSTISSLGLDCEYFGGIPELIHAVDVKATFSDSYFVNFTDGMTQPYSRIQAPLLLDILNVPYSGSDVFSTALINNKHHCKLALQEYGIKTAPSFIVKQSSMLSENLFKSWNYPIFVKPNLEGSSIGISSKNVCHTFRDILHMTNDLLRDFKELIIEEFVYGVDVTVFMLGNDSDFAINDVIISILDDSSEYAVYGALEKRKRLRKLYYNTEYLEEEVINNIRKTSFKIFQAIGARDICRIDYRYDIESGSLNFIEMNSAPRFSPSTEIGFVAEKRNITFKEMVNIYLKVFQNRINHVQRL